MKKCPYCAEEIRDEAVLCRYCGKRVKKNPFAIILITILISSLFIYVAANKPRLEYAKYKTEMFFRSLSRIPEILDRFLDDMEEGVKAYRNYRKNISSDSDIEAELQKYTEPLK